MYLWCWGNIIDRLLRAQKQRSCRQLHSSHDQSYIRCFWFNCPAFELYLNNILHSLDLSVLPGSAPDLLSAPTATTPGFIAVSIAFTFLFFLLFTLTAFRTKMGKAGAFFDKPLIQRSTAWIGLFGFMIGKWATWSHSSTILTLRPRRSYLIPRHQDVVRKGGRRLQQCHLERRTRFATALCSNQ